MYLIRPKLIFKRSIYQLIDLRVRALVAVNVHMSKCSGAGVCMAASGARHLGGTVSCFSLFHSRLAALGVFRDPFGPTLHLITHIDFIIEKYQINTSNDLYLILL